MSKNTGLACPECYAMNDGTTDVEGSDAKPEDGDLSICAYCGSVSILVITDKDSYMRTPLPHERKEIDKNPRIKEAREAILALSLPKPS